MLSGVFEYCCCFARGLNFFVIAHGGFLLLLVVSLGFFARGGFLRVLLLLLLFGFFWVFFARANCDVGPVAQE